MKRGFAAFAFVVLVAAGARADDFTLENVTMSSPLSTYRAARIEVVGANLSREEAMKLLAANNPQPGPDRLARIEAARIAIAELISETKAGDYEQTIVYRDLVASDMARGLAARVESSGARIESRRGDVVSRGRFGAFRMEGVDFAAAMRVAGGVRTSADEAKRQTAASFSMDGIEMDIAEGGRFSAGKMAGRAFAARPLAAPMGSLIEMAPKSAAPADEQTRAAMAAMTADFFTSVDFGALEMNDIAVQVGGDGKAPPAAKLRRIALDGLKDGRLDRFAIEGLETSAPETFRIERMEIAGFDPRPSFIAAASATRRAVPQFDRIEISGLAAAPDAAPMNIGRIVVEAKDWRDLAPTSLKARVDDASVSLAGAGAKRAPVLVALGYENVKLSGSLGARYQAERQEFALEELSVRDESIGAARIGAFLGHVSPALASGDETAMKSALAALVFWRADLHLENAGALNRYVAEQARQLGKPASAVRTNLAFAGKTAVQSLFSPAGGADTRIARLADAVEVFLKGGKSFDLMLSAPEGIGAIDLMMAGRLGALTDRLKIDVKAQ